MEEVLPSPVSAEGVLLRFSLCPLQNQLILIGVLYRLQSFPYLERDEQYILLMSFEELVAQECYSQSYSHTQLEDFFNFAELKPTLEEISNLYEFLEQEQKPIRQHINRRNLWSDEEQRLLDMICYYYCATSEKTPTQLTVLDWEKIGRMLLNRHWKSCRRRWLQGRFQKAQKIRWSNQEDCQLQTILQANKEIKWRDVGIQLSIACGTTYVRSGKQCRERWVNYLNPMLDVSAWSYSEECKLLKAVEENGKQWTLISQQFFEGVRPENQIKNKYHTLIRRQRSTAKSKAKSIQKQNETFDQKAVVQGLLEQYEKQSEIKNKPNNSSQFHINQLIDYTQEFEELMVIKKNQKYCITKIN